MSVARSARDRVRDEVTREILEVAGKHLAQEGAAALSLRSIARDLGMAPSALYRYFDGRDALLSALIVAAYTSLADEAERAAEVAEVAAEQSGDGTVDYAARWIAVPCAMRTWALARPHEWGLIFGSPVPGYRAPEDTMVPYTRLAAAFVRPVAEAYRSGRLGIEESDSESESEPASASFAARAAALDAALAPVRDALMSDAPTSVVLRALQAWSTIIGVVSLEVFGHWRNTVLDPQLFFTETVVSLGDQMGLPKKRVGEI
jgi:AcrR family transcriptional regulator